MSLDKIKSIIDRMPDSKEKEQAKQGYENLKTFETMADVFEKALERKERLMAKYQIIKEWDRNESKYTWLAYEIIPSESNSYICCSLNSAEDCEKKLRECLEKHLPQVVKELEI